MSKQRLSAKDAHSMSALVNYKKEVVTAEQAERALDIIYEEIEKAASAGEKKVTIKWRPVWVQVETPEKPLKEVFPSLVEDLWDWDGGEGYGDKPTETGSYIKENLHANGYGYTLSGGRLFITW